MGNHAFAEDFDSVINDCFHVVNHQVKPPHQALEYAPTYFPLTLLMQGQYFLHSCDCQGGYIALLAVLN